MHCSRMRREGSLDRDSPDRDPHWTDTPMNRHPTGQSPLDIDPTGQSPRTETPRDPLDRDPAPLDRMTDMSKNITLPQTSFSGGNNNLSERCMLSHDFLIVYYQTAKKQHLFVQYRINSVRQMSLLFLRLKYEQPKDKTVHTRS